MAAGFDQVPAFVSTEGEVTTERQLPSQRRSVRWAIRRDQPQPFFTISAPNPGAPRLLLLTYHFPPSNETGALRWEAMVKYAADWGWEVDVVTLAPTLLDDRAVARLGRLPRGCRVYGAPASVSHLERVEAAASLVLKRLKSLRRAHGTGVAAATTPLTPRRGGFEPTAIRADELPRISLSVRQMLRDYFAWREFVIQRPWCREASTIAHALGRANRYDAVITCGPPHLVHTVGASVGRRLGVPLAMDLRDPWSLQQVLPAFRASRLWYRLASRYEQQAVSQASVIALNTVPCRDAMRLKYPAKADAMIVATNGYDEREEIPSDLERDPRFLVAYVGTLYFVYEHPRPFFLGVARLVRERGLTPEQVAVEFIGHSGNYEGEPLEDIAQATGLGGYFHSSPHRPRVEVLPRLARASVLVSLAQFNDFAIPSKIFDYMRFPAWVLAIAKPGTATDLLLRGTDADLVPSNDEQLIYQALCRRYEEFARGVRPKPIAGQTQSSRGEQATLFFEAVRRAVGEGVRR